MDYEPRVAGSLRANYVYRLPAKRLRKNGIRHAELVEKIADISGQPPEDVDTIVLEAARQMALALIRGEPIQLRNIGYVDLIDVSARVLARCRPGNTPVSRPEQKRARFRVSRIFRRDAKASLIGPAAGTDSES